ncbi:helix-turn-helix transcriptional regulator [Actinocatenispora sera]|uniref:helix-turn-helix domain-containing protein n=1 Tax=Actinocatenispora sera TaxID=390989 RepID=UPI0033FBBD99
MPANPTQVAARRQLGEELRRLRTAVPLTGQQVAQALGWHQSKVSRIEAGKNLIRAEDVEALLPVLRADPDEARRLLGLAAVNVGEPGSWRNSSRSGLTRRQRDFIALEASAVQIAHYQPVLLPGYLQSPAYAKRVAEMAGATDTERAVEQRLARRATLMSTSGPEYRIVLLETVLRWRPFGVAEMAEQLDLVAELADRPNVDLRIVSLDAEQVAYVQHPFMVFDFDDEIQAEALVETTTQDVHVKDPTALGSLRHYFGQLSSSALTPAGSLALVRSVAASYRDRA